MTPIAQSIVKLSDQLEGLNPRLHKEKQINAEISHSLLDTFWGLPYITASPKALRLRSRGCSSAG